MKLFKTALIIVSLIFTLCLPAYAEGELSDYYDTLPPEIKDSFPDDFENTLSEGSISDAVAHLDFPYVLKLILKALKSSVSSLLPSLVVLISTVFLSSVMYSFSEGETDTPLRTVNAVCRLGLCASVIIPTVKAVKASLEGMSALMASSVPLLTAVGLSSGQSSSTSVNAIWLNTALTLLDSIQKSILIPIVGICFCFCVVNSVSKSCDGVNMDGLVSTVKRVFVFLSVVICTVLNTVMCFQNVIAKGSDTVLLRSIRFASGNAIPIVGNALSEAAGTYLSSVSLIKSSFGTIGAIAVIVSVLPIIIKLLVLKGVLIFTNMISTLLPSFKGTEIIEMSSIIDILLTVTAVTSFTFIIVLGVFASTLPV